MDRVYLLYGEKCGAEELLGIYDKECLAGIVGAAFTTNGTYEHTKVECWQVQSDAFIAPQVQSSWVGCSGEPSD